MNSNEEADIGRNYINDQEKPKQRNNSNRNNNMALNPPLINNNNNINEKRHEGIEHPTNVISDVEDGEEEEDAPFDEKFSSLFHCNPKAAALGCFGTRYALDDPPGDLPQCRLRGNNNDDTTTTNPGDLPQCRLRGNNNDDTTTTNYIMDQKSNIIDDDSDDDGDNDNIISQKNTSTTCNDNPGINIITPKEKENSNIKLKTTQKEQRHDVLDEETDTSSPKSNNKSSNSFFTMFCDDPSTNTSTSSKRNTTCSYHGMLDTTEEIFSKLRSDDVCHAFRSKKSKEGSHVSPMNKKMFIHTTPIYDMPPFENTCIEVDIEEYNDGIIVDNHSYTSTSELDDDSSSIISGPQITMINDKERNATIIIPKVHVNSRHYDPSNKAFISPESSTTVTSEFVKDYISFDDRMNINAHSNSSLHHHPNQEKFLGSKKLMRAIQVVQAVVNGDTNSNSKTTNDDSTQLNVLLREPQQRPTHVVLDDIQCDETLRVTAVVSQNHQQQDTLTYVSDPPLVSLQDDDDSSTSSSSPSTSFMDEASIENNNDILYDIDLILEQQNKKHLYDDNDNDDDEHSINDEHSIDNNVIIPDDQDSDNVSATITTLPQHQQHQQQQQRLNNSYSNTRDDYFLTQINNNKNDTTRATTKTINDRSCFSDPGGSTTIDNTSNNNTSSLFFHHDILVFGKMTIKSSNNNNTNYSNSITDNNTQLLFDEFVGGDFEYDDQVDEDDTTDNVYVNTADNDYINTATSFKIQGEEEGQHTDSSNSSNSIHKEQQPITTPITSKLKSKHALLLDESETTTPTTVESSYQSFSSPTTNTTDAEDDISLFDLPSSPTSSEEDVFDRSMLLFPTIISPPQEYDSSGFSNESYFTAQKEEEIVKDSNESSKKENNNHDVSVDTAIDSSTTTITTTNNINKSNHQQNNSSRSSRRYAEKLKIVGSSFVMARRLQYHSTTTTNVVSVVEPVNEVEIPQSEKDEIDDKDDEQIHSLVDVDKEQPSIRKDSHDSIMDTSTISMNQHPKKGYAEKFKMVESSFALARSLQHHPNVVTQNEEQLQLVDCDPQTKLSNDIVAALTTSIPSPVDPDKSALSDDHQSEDECSGPAFKTHIDHQQKEIEDETNEAVENNCAMEEDNVNTEDKQQSTPVAVVNTSISSKQRLSKIMDTYMAAATAKQPKEDIQRSNNTQEKRNFVPCESSKMIDDPVIKDHVIHESPLLPEEQILITQSNKFSMEGDTGSAIGTTIMSNNIEALDTSLIYSDMSSIMNSSIVSSDDVVVDNTTTTTNNKLIDIHPPEEKEDMALGDYLEEQQQHHQRNTTYNNTNINNIISSTTISTSGSSSFISDALGIRSSGSISTERRRGGAGKTRLIHEKATKQRLKSRSNSSSYDGWFDTIQKAAARGKIPDHTWNFESGWVLSNTTNDISSNSSRGSVVEVMSNMSSSFDDSSVYNEPPGCNTSTNENNDTNNLQSNIHYCRNQHHLNSTSTLRNTIPSPISEVESRQETEDCSNSNSDDNSSTTTTSQHSSATSITATSSKKAVSFIDNLNVNDDDDDIPISLSDIEDKTKTNINEKNIIVVSNKKVSKEQPQEEVEETKNKQLSAITITSDLDSKNTTNTTIISQPKHDDTSRSRSTANTIITTDINKMDLEETNPNKNVVGRAVVDKEDNNHPQQQMNHYVATSSEFPEIFKTDEAEDVRIIIPTLVEKEKCSEMDGSLFSDELQQQQPHYDGDDGSNSMIANNDDDNKCGTVDKFMIDDSLSTILHESNSTEDSPIMDKDIINAVVSSSNKIHDDTMITIPFHKKNDEQVEEEEINNDSKDKDAFSDKSSDYESLGIVSPQSSDGEDLADSFQRGSYGSVAEFLNSSSQSISSPIHHPNSLPCVTNNSSISSNDQKPSGSKGLDRSRASYNASTSDKFPSVSLKAKEWMTRSASNSTTSDSPHTNRSDPNKHNSIPIGKLRQSISIFENNSKQNDMKCSLGSQCSDTDDSSSNPVGKEWKSFYEKKIKAEIATADASNNNEQQQRSDIENTKEEESKDSNQSQEDENDIHKKFNNNYVHDTFVQAVRKKQPQQPSNRNDFVSKDTQLLDIIRGQAARAAAEKAGVRRNVPAQQHIQDDESESSTDSEDPNEAPQSFFQRLVSCHTPILPRMKRTSSSRFSKGEEEDKADPSSIPSAHLSFLFNAAAPLLMCTSSNQTSSTPPPSEQQLPNNTKPVMRIPSTIDEKVEDQEENDIASSQRLRVQDLRDIKSLTNYSASSKSNETASAYIGPKSQIVEDITKKVMTSEKSIISSSPPSQTKTNNSIAWEAFLAARKTNKNSSLSNRSRVSVSEMSKAAEKLTSETFDAILSKNKLQQSNTTDQVQNKIDKYSSISKSIQDRKLHSSFPVAKESDANELINLQKNSVGTRKMYDEARMITPKVHNRKMPLNTTKTKNSDITNRDFIQDHSNNPKWIINQNVVPKSHNKKQIITSAEALAAAKVEAMMASF